MTSPEQQTTPTGGGMPTIPSGARLPIPGNAEFALYFVMWVVLAIIWAATDSVNAALFAILTTVLSFGYFISRGIAKASEQ
jgi:hypothetical protein